jgi:hypothetical protein
LLSLNADLPLLLVFGKIWKLISRHSTVRNSGIGREIGREIITDLRAALCSICASYPTFFIAPTYIHLPYCTWLTKRRAPSQYFGYKLL